MDEGKKMLNRRDSIKMLGLGSAGILGMFGGISDASAFAQDTPSYAKGMAPVTIKSVKAI